MKLAVPAASLTVRSLIDKVAASLSVIVPVPVASAMVTKPPVMPLRVIVHVSDASTIASLVIGTVKVCVAPVLELAGKVNVPLLAE